MSKAKRKYKVEAFSGKEFTFDLVPESRENGHTKKTVVRKLPDFITVEMIRKIIARIQEL